MHRLNLARRTCPDVPDRSAGSLATPPGPQSHEGRLNVAAKIWLAISIFILGFVFCAALASLQGRNAEQRLGNTSEALFPAALWSQDAEATFHRAVQAFSDAVVMQDSASLSRAARDGSHSVQSLRKIAAVAGLSPARAAEAKSLAVSCPGSA